MAFWPEKVFFSMVEPIENVKLLWHCILIFHSSVQLFRIDWIELVLGWAIWNTFLLSFPASDTTTICAVCYFFNMELQHSNCSILTGLRLHLVEQYGTGRVAAWWHNTMYIIYVPWGHITMYYISWWHNAMYTCTIHHIYNIHHGGTISNGGRLVAQYQILRPSPSATATQYFRLISLRLPPSSDWHWPPTTTWSTQNNPESGVLCRIWLALAPNNNMVHLKQSRIRSP